MLGFHCVDVRELVVAKDCGALRKDLEGVDGHTGQDSRLVVVEEEDAMVARDDVHTRCSLDDGGNGTYGDMVVGDRLDVDSILVGLVVLRNSAVGEQQPRQVVEQLDEAEEHVHVLYDRTLQMFR